MYAAYDAIERDEAGTFAPFRTSSRELRYTPYSLFQIGTCTQWLLSHQSDCSVAANPPAYYIY